MASFSKRGGKHRVFIRKGDTSQSKTFDKKADAQAWAARMETQISDGKLGNIPDQPFSAILERYRDKVSPNKRGCQWEQARLNMALRDKLAQVPLRELNETHVAAWRDRRLQTVQRSSVRREWTLYSHACTLAVKEWKWLRVNPFRGADRPAPVPPRNVLYTDKQIEKLTYALGLDPGTVTGRVGIAFLLAIETGMRAGEIRSIQRKHMHLDRHYVHLTKTKNGLERDVPLSKEAVRLLKLLPQNGQDVFCLTDQQLDALFRKGKQRAMVDGLTFHDTRHLAITRLSKKLDVLSLARMVGHKDLRQLMTYYNESAEDMAKKL